MITRTGLLGAFLRRTPRVITPLVVPSSGLEAVVEIRRGGSVVVGADDLGELGTAGVAVDVTYTITNRGLSNLTGHVVVEDVVNVTTEVVVGGSFDLPPGASVTVTVRVTATAAGSLGFDVHLLTSAGQAEYSVAATATAAGAVLGQWVNLRAWFNARNASSVQPGAPDQAGLVTLNSLGDDADSWPVNVTTAGDASGVPELAAWLAALEDVWVDAADAPTETAIAFEVRAPGAVTSGLGFAGIVGNPAAAIASSAGLVEQSGAGKVWQGGDEDSNSGASGDAIRCRGIVLMAPGSVTRGIGVVAAYSRNGGDAPVETTPATGRVDVADLGSNTMQVGVGTGSRFTILTGATGDYEVLAKAVAQPRIRKDGGIGWNDIAFPGASGRIDPSSVYVSDGGAHATDWLITVSAANGYTAKGWNPASGNKHLRIPITMPGGVVLDGSKPIDFVLEPLGSWSTSAVFAGLLLHNGTNGYLCDLLQGSGTRSTEARFNTQTFTVASNAAIKNLRAFWAPTVGASGGKYHGLVTPVPYTDTGPYAARGQYTNGTSFTGDLQAEIVIGVPSGAGNRIVHFRAQVRNVDLSMTETAVAA